MRSQGASIVLVNKSTNRSVISEIYRHLGLVDSWRQGHVILSRTVNSPQQISWGEGGLRETRKRKGGWHGAIIPHGNDMHVSSLARAASANFLL